jgi:hypothetical protein
MDLEDIETEIEGLTDEEFFQLSEWMATQIEGGDEEEESE